MSIHKVLLLLIAPLVLTGCSAAAPNEFATIVLPNETQIIAGVADSQSERQQGLSGRESLSENEGLLFIHESKSIPSYWMKDMLITLDFIWLNEGIVVDLTENVPPEDPPTTFYRPDSLVDQVLEVNAGFIEKHGLSVGDYLDIELPDE